jgi:predicted nucleotidyltransferase component of viral defense system
MVKSVREWASAAPIDNIEFRKAIHITLMAISICEELSESMVMKGGMLMGIRYESSRHTTDIDFSTKRMIKEVDIPEFKENLNDRLLEARAELLYEVECKVQSVKIQPNKEATFPSLKVKIGYASTSNINQLKRLKSGSSPQTISIDYSFNEETGSVDELYIDGSEKINVYSLASLISEKYRSVLQQPKRKRNRRQDIYDLYYLITNYTNNSLDEKTEVLELLFKKSEGKGIDEYLIPTALNNKKIREMSEENYHLIADEIEGILPEFKVSYLIVKKYYESLPWKYHLCSF